MGPKGKSLDMSILCVERILECNGVPQLDPPSAASTGFLLSCSHIYRMIAESTPRTSEVKIFYNHQMDCTSEREACTNTIYKDRT